MDKNIFREKSIDRINSPEAMKDYMQVATPGVWMMLIGIIILLGGAIVWSVLGTVETKIPAVVVMENGKGTCYFKESADYAVAVGMKVEVNDASCSIEEVARVPEKLTADNSYMANMLGNSDSILVIPANITLDIPDGVYRGSIVTEEITPIKFLTN